MRRRFVKPGVIPPTVSHWTAGNLISPASAGAAFMMLYNFAGHGLTAGIQFLRLSGSIAFIMFVLGAGFNGLAFSNRFSAIGFGRTTFKLLSVFLLFAAGAAAFLTGSTVESQKESRSASGLKLEIIESVRVTLTDDPRIFRADSWAARGYLLETRSRNLAAEARGSVVVSGRGAREGLAAGRVVDFRGSFVETVGQSEGRPFRYHSDSWETSGWSSGYHRLRYGVLRSSSRKLESLEPQTQSFVSILLLGQKTENSSYLSLTFGKAGILHLLALSGFHLGLIAAAVRLVLKKWIGRTAATIVSVLCALIFLGLVGARPSLVRAVLMYMLWALDNCRGRIGRPWFYLSTAFLIQSLLNPESSATLSFRLSYLALTGILAAAKAWTQLLSRRMPIALAGPVAVGISAQMATLPLVCSVFAIWRPVGLLASLIISPLTAFSMICGAVVFLSLNVPMLGNLSVRIVEASVSLTVAAAELFGSIPGVEGGVLRFSWPIALWGTILPHILLRRLSRELLGYTEPRLPSLNPCLPRKSGDCAAEEVGPKLPGESGCPREDSLEARTQKRSEGLGDWSRTRRHERVNHRFRGPSDSLRNRPGVLRFTRRPARSQRATTDSRGCDENLGG